MALLLMVNTAHAQYTSYFATPDDGYATVFSGGYDVGANFCQVDGDLLGGYHKVGLSAGGVVYVRFSEKLGVSVELLYSQKGSKSRTLRESMAGLAVEAYDIKLNYVEVPVMFRVFGSKRVHYGIGASYSRLIKSKEEAYANGNINLYPDINFFRKSDLCFAADVSYEFYKGSFISLRYNRSLMSIRDAQRIPQGFGGGDAPGQFNNYFTLRLIHLFRGEARQ